MDVSPGIIRSVPPEEHGARKRSFSQPEQSYKGLQKRNSSTPMAAPFIMVPSLGDIPSERYGHTAIVSGKGNEESLYIFGGCNSNHKHFSNELYVFHFRTREWRNLTPELISSENADSDLIWPQGRHFHSAVNYQNQMIIFGGKSNGYRNDIYAFNYEMEEWSLIVPKGDTRISRRYGHTAVVNNDSMYIFGGYDDFGLKCNDLWHFCFNTNEWNQIQSLGNPPERYHHSAVVFEGSIYVFGGFQGYDDLFEYRFGSRTWSLVNTKGAPPNPRWGHRAVSVKRCMYVFGGCDLVINYNDIHRFHFDSGRWEKLPGGGYTQGYFQSAVVNHSKIYIFGGKNIHNYNFNDLYEYRMDIVAKANPNTFEEDFRNMLFDNEFADVVFSFPTEGRQIMAHRYVLFARCSRFRELIPGGGGRFTGQIEMSSCIVTQSEFTPSPKPKARKSKPKEKTTKRKKRKRKKTVEKTLLQPVEELSSKNMEELSIKSVVETKQEPEREIIPYEKTVPFVVIIKDTKYDIYRRFLEYIYSGYLDMPQPYYAFELLPLALHYKLEYLQTVCVVKIQQNITVDNVLVALQLAHCCKEEVLKSFCLSYIGDHRSEVTPALRKGGLHPDLLKDVKKWLTLQNLEKMQGNTTPVYQSILT